jgi:hypothetical protein
MTMQSNGRAASVADSRRLCFHSLYLLVHAPLSFVLQFQAKVYHYVSLTLAGIAGAGFASPGSTKLTSGKFSSAKYATPKIAEHSEQLEDV